MGIVQDSPATRGRKSCPYKEKLDTWFQDLESYLQEQGVQDVLEDGPRIFNCDESGFPLAGKMEEGRGLKLSVHTVLLTRHKSQCW